MSHLKSLIKGRKWIARLVWIHAIDPQYLGWGKGAALGLIGPSIDDRHFVTESDKATIGHITQDSDEISDHDSFMDYFFKGSSIQEFLYRFCFILSGSFMQLALFDGNESRISDLLDEREAIESPKPSSFSTLQCLTHPSQIIVSESEPNFNIDSLPSDASYSDEGFMVICGWELPSFLSLSNLSLINDEMKDVDSLQRFHEALHSRSEDGKALEEKWHNMMSVVLKKVRNMVVLTGDCMSVRAGTCGEIMEELCKGDLGVTFLNQLLYYAAGVLASRPDSIQVLQPPDAVDSIHVLRVTKTNIMVLFDDDVSADRLSMTKALIWLCQTLRRVTEPSSPTLYQSAIWNAIDYHEWQADRVSVFILRPLKEEKFDPKNNCWQGLFQSGVVSYRSSTRDWRIGLQIPFTMLVQLAAVDNYLWVDCETKSNGEESPALNHSGGYILYGFYTALTPIQYDVSSNSIQWHFERSLEKIISPFELQATRTQWYKFRDYRRFASCTCFVGWCEIANVILGTKELSNMVAWSGLPSRTRTLHKSGKTLVGQLGVSGPIPIQATFQGETSYTYVNNVQNFLPGAPYARAINETSRQVALVYDSGVGKAWLVPKLSLLLHLCHRYFHFFKSSELTIEDPIPFANPSFNGADAARQALFNKGDVVLQWHGGNDIDRILLRQVLVDINTNISGTSLTRELPDRANFFGTELMTMVANPEMSNGLGKITSKDASESWYGLVEYVDAVFVCSNIGSAIQPYLPAAISKCPCIEIPEKRQYLVAHMWCLEIILERRGIDINKLSSEVLKINQNYDWCWNGQPFEGCPHDCQQTDYWKDVEAILQKISRRHLLSSKPTPTFVNAPPPISGAVIFGSSSSPGWLKRKRSSVSNTV